MSIVFWLFFLLVVVLPLSLIFKMVMKSKKSSWSGKIIDKKHNTVEDMDDNKPRENYFVVVKMDGGGRDRNIAMSKQLWETFKIGDKIKKPAGKLIPEKA